tara:strand:- start:186 stop:872 length:687 start_codon:yes stop_codon:yes gene_type:complete
MADNDRTLSIEIPSMTVSKLTGETTWTTLSGANGWTVVEALGLPGTVMSWSGTIDLSGYARDYKTFYPAGGVIQQGPYVLETLGGGLVLYTVVSSTPLNPENVQWQLAMNGGPGFLNNTGALGGGLGQDQQNPTTIMFAESQLFVPNVNIQPNTFGVQQPLSRNQSGSMEPTASDTLYVVSLYYPLEQGMTGVVIPAQRVILPGTMDQEPELEYMMRLSRSIELANQV